MSTVAHRYADATLDRLWDGFTYLVMRGGRQPLRTRIARRLAPGPAATAVVSAPPQATRVGA